MAINPFFLLNKKGETKKKKKQEKTYKESAVNLGLIYFLNIFQVLYKTFTV